MKKTAYQTFPDGTRVRFTQEARDRMRQTSFVIKPLPTPGKGADAVYTIDNSDDLFHDVILRETGERYGAIWLEAVATPSVHEHDETRPPAGTPADGDDSMRDLPKIWKTRDSEHIGKVDFDDDKKRTVVTAWVDHEEPGHHMHIEPFVLDDKLTIEIHLEDRTLTIRHDLEGDLTIQTELKKREIAKKTKHKHEQTRRTRQTERDRDTPIRAVERIHHHSTGEHL